MMLLTLQSILVVETEKKQALLVKIASVREVVLGAPLRVVLKHLSSRTVASDADGPIALVHRPKESFFLVPQVKYDLEQVAVPSSMTSLLL